MKKSLSLSVILFFFIAVNLPCFAFLTTDDAISEKYIENHGHSDEMARLIDLQHAQINGTAPTYKEHEAWYTSKLPSWVTEKQVNFVRQVFMYFDCGLDDGKFMQNNTKYTSRWDDL